MPDFGWGTGHLKLGRIAEHYAVLEFLSHGFEVYTPEVDDHGVDFIARDRGTGELFEVQVKSIFKGKYAFIRKDRIALDERHLVCFLRFEAGKEPETYIIPARAWETPDAVLVDRAYGRGRKSKPEWGIQYSKKNAALLEKYRAEHFFGSRIPAPGRGMPPKKG